ncbi:MAG: cytochrome P450 [Bacteroidetes bacterium]|nr:cytochrome P450 [Bacteroidota bacterium]
MSSGKPYRIHGLALVRLVPGLLTNPLPLLNKLANKHHHRLTFDAGKYQRIHVVSDPDAVKHLLKTNAENYSRSAVINALKPLLGDGIFIADGEHWKKQHNDLKPAVREEHFELYNRFAEEECAQLINQWKTRGSANIEIEIKEMMLRILLKIMFGEVVEENPKEIIRIHQQILNVTGIERQKVDYFKRRIIGRSVYRKTEREYKSHLQHLELKVSQWIKNADRKKSPFLFHLQHSTDQECRDMILNMVFAGYDTTASALSWTIYNLAAHPEIQRKCRDEIQEHKTEYLKNVIQESMRLYPPVWSLLRQAQSSDQIGDWQTSAGEYFMIDVNSLHRNPEKWENPEQFIPERFSANQKGMAFSYIPFGQGQRMCIGKPLANRELEFILPILLKYFSFELSSKKLPVVRPDIIVTAKGKLPILINEIK